MQPRLHFWLTAVFYLLGGEGLILMSRLCDPSLWRCQVSSSRKPLIAGSLRTLPAKGWLIAAPLVFLLFFFVPENLFHLQRDVSFQMARIVFIISLLSAVNAGLFFFFFFFLRPFQIWIETLICVCLCVHAPVCVSKPCLINWVAGRWTLITAYKHQQWSGAISGTWAESGLFWELSVLVPEWYIAHFSLLMDL